MVTLLVAVPFYMAVALTAIIGSAAVLSGRFIVAAGRVADFSSQLFVGFSQFVCCRSVVYRVFNLCVAGALYTGCSI
jgi:hypothetical protein